MLYLRGTGPARTEHKKCLRSKRRWGAVNPLEACCLTSLERFSPFFFFFFFFRQSFWWMPLLPRLSGSVLVAGTGISHCHDLMAAILEGGRGTFCPRYTQRSSSLKKNHRGYLSINRSDLFLLNILRFMFLLRFKREKKNIVDDFGPGAFLEQNILKSGHRSPFCCDWSDGPLKRSGRSRGHVPPSLETCAKKKSL